MKRRTFALLKTVPVLLILFAPIPALADQFVLDFDHTGQFGSGPYGTIDITPNGSNTVHVVINFGSDLEFLLTGQTGATLAFNLVGNPTIDLPNTPYAG